VRDVLADWIRSARERTLALAAGLSGDQLLGPRLAIVNPPLWELGHVGWFQERWVLRHAAGAAAVRADGDALYDSAPVAHDTRWSLPLPGLPETLGYLREVEARVLARLERGAADPYFVRLSVFHEDMHFEAMAFTRQTLGLAAPPLPGASAAPAGGGDLPGDVEIPGGSFLLGADRGEEFVFDNEKWAHPVALVPFRISRAPVTQGRFAEFVADGGYRGRALWSEDGWRWREAAGAQRPAYWGEAGGGAWMRRDFDTATARSARTGRSSWRSPARTCTRTSRRRARPASRRGAGTARGGREPALPVAR